LILVENSKSWVQYEDAARDAWMDVVEFDDAGPIRSLLGKATQANSGILTGDAYAFVTYQFEPGEDAVSAGLSRDRYLLNFGIALPFKIAYDGHTTATPEQLEQISSKIDTLSGMIEHFTRRADLDYALPSNSQQLSRGTFTAPGNQLRDPTTGLSVKLAPGWTLERAIHSSDRRTTFSLRDPSSPAVVQLEFSPSPKQNGSSDPERANRSVMQARTKARQSDGWQDYRLRAKNVEYGAIGGVPTGSWLADYTEHGQPMVEYFTRIRGLKTTALVSAHLPASEFEAFRARFDPIVETLRLSSDDAAPPRRQSPPRVFRGVRSSGRPRRIGARCPSPCAWTASLEISNCNWTPALPTARSRPIRAVS